MRKSADIVSEGAPYWWRPNAAWGGESQSGEEVDTNSLLTSATCFACTKVLSETIAGLPGQTYKYSKDRKEAESQSVAFELLTEQPNPEMDAFTFWELLITRVTNSGNFFAEIQRDHRDVPIALWPIHPSRIRPLRDAKDQSLYWEITNDYTGSPEYNDPTWRANHLHNLSPHNVLNIVGFGSQNGIISPGMLPAYQEIGMDFASRRYGSEFFRDGAQPNGVVQHPGYIDNEPKRNLFREDINRIHNQTRHQIGVLWQGATYQAISVAPEQAQFLETRKFTSDQLCKFYGVPPAIIGDYEYSKFATADAMIRAFVMTTLRSLAVRCEKAINRQILNVRGENGRLEKAFTKNLIYRIAIDGLLRGDPKTLAETHAAYRTMGVLKTNEIREEIGYNAVEGEEGDYLIVNGGMSRLSKIDEQGNRQTQPADKKDASLPQFGQKQREQLAEVLERAIEPTAVSVPGFNPSLRSAAIKITQSAMNRIDKITATQVERWREQDPETVAAKLPEFWAKQKSRFQDSLEPLTSLDIDPSPIVADYFEMVSKIDNYSIFGEHPKLNIEESIDAAIG